MPIVDVSTGTFRNPFPVGGKYSTGKQATDQYRDWLWERLKDPKDGPRRIKLLASMSDAKFECDCGKQHCHAKVLQAASHWAVRYVGGFYQ